MLHAAHSLKHVFDCKPGDVFWCTADIGWITGHTFGVYGPLLIGVTSVMVIINPTFRFHFIYGLISLHI
jgi:acetyl-CoA synthetase